MGFESLVPLPLMVAAAGLLWAASKGGRARIPLVLRRWGYPSAIVVILTAWAFAMTALDRWSLFVEYWPISLTMALGSFVAGATAEGGGAVAFPVFTKIFGIAATDARDFGLMIQSVGMMLAGFVILLRGVRVDGAAILWVSLGAAIGQVIGLLHFQLGGAQAKILFSLGAATFGLSLLIARFLLRLPVRNELPVPVRAPQRLARRALFIMIGLVGGAFASVTGTGADILAFILLTLGLGLDERHATPTSVIIMAVNSVVGFALRSVVEPEIGLAWDLWLVALPVVIFGAPLGALAAAHASRDQIITVLCSLIVLDLASTLILVDFGPSEQRLAAWVCVAGLTVFAVLLSYRLQYCAGIHGGRHASRGGDSIDDESVSARAERARGTAGARARG